MKTVEMLRSFDYAAHPRIVIRFQAGIVYRRVIEAATTAIVRAGAGRVLAEDRPGATATGFTVVDSSHVWKRRRKA